MYTALRMKTIVICNTCNARRIFNIITASICLWILLNLMKKPVTDTNIDEYLSLISECFKLTRNAENLSWVCDLNTEPPREWHGEYFEANAMSAVGRHLYLDEGYNEMSSNKTFKILMWKFGNRLAPRFMNSFGNVSRDPFFGCAATNCEINYNSTDLSEADAVIFHLHLTKNVVSLPYSERIARQRWIFLTDESPYHTFMRYRGKLRDFNNVFNWSMSYRSDSDVPVPYGRTIFKQGSPKRKNIDYHANKSKFISVLGSNCGGTSRRWTIIRLLEKTLTIDRWGNCQKSYQSAFKCPGGFKKDCPGINDYRFYLTFENSLCREYITEKLWWNAYHKEAIPVVWGGLSRQDYDKLTPPRSLIHVDDFQGPDRIQDLANFLIFLNNNPVFYNKFHTWRQTYEIVNEHGYFGAPNRHYCRICEALNYNDPAPKTYTNLESFISVNEDCRQNVSNLFKNM